MSKREDTQLAAYDLHLQGKNVREIAAELGINKDTAAKYVRTERKHRFSLLSEDDRAFIIQASIEEKNEIMELARQGYDEASNASLNKSGYLNTMLAASSAKDKVRGLLKDRVDITSGDEPLAVTIKFDRANDSD